MEPSITPSRLDGCLVSTIYSWPISPIYSFVGTCAGNASSAGGNCVKGVVIEDVSMEDIGMESAYIGGAYT